MLQFDLVCGSTDEDYAPSITSGIILATVSLTVCHRESVKNIF